MITDVELSRLDEEGNTADRYVNANIFNISRGGIGFETMYPLEIGSYYDTRFTLWSAVTGTAANLSASPTAMR